MSQTNLVDMFGNPIIAGFQGPYRCFSNFSYHQINWNDIDFPSNEFAYQWAKTEIPAQKEAILKCNNSGEAKILGGDKKKTTERKDWKLIKIATMLEINRLKYESHSDVRQILLDTDQAVLIEQNLFHDNFWGDCVCQKCHRIKGLNKLGEILMQIRDEMTQG